MPPKKKGKGKKGKKKGKKKNDAELTIEDKYKRTLHEIEALKDHLGLLERRKASKKPPPNRKELARRSQSHSEEWKNRMRDVEQDLQQHQVDQRDVTADMTRQYKTMQTEMESKVRHLEVELSKTRSQLAKTEKRLQATEEEKNKITKEKDIMIAELQERIGTMERSFEVMLHEALDNLVHKLDAAKHRWHSEATHIHMINKQKLLEFGLNPLDI